MPKLTPSPLVHGLAFHAMPSPSWWKSLSPGASLFPRKAVVREAFLSQSMNCTKREAIPPVPRPAPRTGSRLSLRQCAFTRGIFLIGITRAGRVVACTSVVCYARDGPSYPSSFPGYVPMLTSCRLQPAHRKGQARPMQHGRKRFD